MAKDIKTKDVVRSVKEHTGSAAKDKITEAGIRTKDKIVGQFEEQANPEINRQNTQKPENYATDEVTEKAKTAAEITGEKAERVVKKSVKTIRDKRAEKKAQAENELDEPLPEYKPDNPEPDNNQSTPQDKKTQDAKKKAQEKTKKDIKEKEPQAAKGRGSDSDTVSETEKSVKKKNIKNSVDETAEEKKKPKPKQRQRQEIKTRNKQNIKNTDNNRKAIKQINSDAKKVKEARRSAEATGRTIKTAEKSAEATRKGVKTAEQTAKQTAKATKKAAEETAKATKEAAKITKETAKATAKAVKVTAKAIAEGAKAVGAAIKEIAAAVVAGGPVVIIIVVICLIAAIGGTCFGIFLANDESTGTQMKMSDAITDLTSEYYNSLTAMKLQFTCDTVEISGDTSINWKDVLAIYAVKYTNSSDGFDVATLDDDKIEKLETIMKIMNPLTGVVVPKVIPTVTYVTGADGKKVKKTVNETKKVLIITAAHISANTQATVYRFDDEQKKQLNEILGDDYDALWAELIGSSAEILLPSGEHISKGAFSWPLTINGTITSRFGTRSDPITGETETHSGTDIAAPTGTPILSAADGIVELAGNFGNGYGNYVIIRHSITTETLYGHCSVLNVRAGQLVKKGQKIAEVGSTGYSTGPHLHFEVIINGTKTDAMKYFK